jgi:hypothetical protein
MENFRKTSSASSYVILNDKNMNKECPGSQYDRTRDISIMILEILEDCKEDFYLKDITYLTLDDAYKKYIIDNCNMYPFPFDNKEVIYPEILKRRIVSQIEYRKYKNQDDKDDKDDKDKKYDKDECFLKYCLDTISDEEKIYLENTLYFDDNLIDWDLSSDFNLREKAVSMIKNSSDGSWLVRRSSIKEQEHTKIRVITCKVKDEIKNYLVAHINGFGYILTLGVSGSSTPYLGEKKTIKIYMTFYSLPELLNYMKLQGIELSKIIKNN